MQDWSMVILMNFEVYEKDRVRENRMNELGIAEIQRWTDFLKDMENVYGL
jgi:hypothetical protein